MQNALVSFLVTALLAAILLAVGGRIRGWVRLPLPPGLHLPADLCIGSWAVAMVVLAESIAGLTSPWWMALPFASAAAVGRWRRWRYDWPSVGVAAAGGMIALLVALGPPFFYDAMVYHLGLPWQALRDGALLAHPENVFSTFPPLAQLLAMPPLAFGLDRVPALLHWGMWVATSAAVQSVTRRAGASRVCRYTVGAIVPLLPVLPMVAGFPAAEGWFLAPLLSSIALLLGRPTARVTTGVGFFLGIAAAARLQALPWTVLVLLAALLRSRSPRRVAVAGLVWWLGAAPWWAKNLILLGDPLAPLWWDRPGLETLWRDSHSAVKAGEGLIASLSHVPILLRAELVYLVPLILLAAVAARHRGAPRVLFALAVGGVIAWPLTGALPRFFAAPLLLILAVVSTLNGRTSRRLVATAAIVWCGLVGAWRSLDLVLRIRPLSLLARNPAEAGAILLPNDPQGFFGELQALPPDARVLIVGDARGFGCPRAFVVTSQHDLSPLAGILADSPTPAQTSQRLRLLGFTHLLVNWRELDRLHPSYPVAPWRDDETRLRFSKLMRALGRPVLRGQGIDLYALESP